MSEDTALVSENTVLVLEDTALVAIPFRVCKLAKNDPNVSVRRIEASFRKWFNSLSGLQVGEKAIQTILCGGSRLPFGSGAIPFRVCKLAKRRSKRFCAEDRGFLSEAGRFPFKNLAVHRECTGSAPGVHRKCTRSAPGVHQECTRSAPKCTRSAPEVHQKCTRVFTLRTDWSSQQCSPVHGMAT